jgi:hypothetical protein
MGFNEQQLSIFERNIEDGKQRTEAKKAAKNNRVEGVRIKERPELQKQSHSNSTSDQGRDSLSQVRKKRNGAPDLNSKKRTSSVDERMRYRFRCTIVVAISDRRARDINGAASTLLDVIRDAGRKFIELYPEYADWAKQNIPEDDSFIDIPILNVVAAMVPRGCEGATVYLERLTETEIAAWRRQCEIGDFFEPLSK